MYTPNCICDQLHLQQAFREFLVSLALISNLNGHQQVSPVENELGNSQL